LFLSHASAFSTKRTLFTAAPLSFRTPFTGLPFD
jgi:hypothetical protein